MRPEILFALFTKNSTLKGIGPRLSVLVERLCGPNVVNLLWHLPSNIVDRRYSPKLAEANDGEIVTVTVTINAHHPAPNRRAPYKITCSDETGYLELIFFNARSDYLNRTFPEGETRIISGTVERFNGFLQMTHPDKVGTLDERDAIQSVDPIYPLTGGLSNKVCRKAVIQALEKCPTLPEWHNQALQDKHGWPSWNEAILRAHNPQDEDDLLPLSKYRERLAYDELLANQLALSLIRRAVRKVSGREVAGDGKLRKIVQENLPFSLTNSQATALEEIYQDMAQPLRMLRLLQGDVGSGKTVVALLAALNAIETGAQAAIMAPTEILARQHFEGLQEMLSDCGVRIDLLTGREKGKKRTAILEKLLTGETDLLVGTHALFQEDVAFKDLALAVIDEQHRFGVHQRLALSDKGNKTDILVMTATPIPRTLVLTAYGDMDISALREKPAGRKPIDTRVLPVGRLDEIAHSLSRLLKTGERIYWVCPLVEESDTLSITAAEERFEHLHGLYGDKVGMVHGKMKGADKDATMAAFAKGDIEILVATTVIEVGVNVPEATVMVIEHAERFGLAQLHQLRGRIGRGSKASSCLLLYGAPLSENGQSRLKIMRETEDGFLIAEEDLRLRGAGEVLGTKQSGVEEFKLADMPAHADLLPIARDDARLILMNDPNLETERGKALKTLLYLFEKDSTVAYLRSG